MIQLKPQSEDEKKRFEQGDILNKVRLAPFRRTPYVQINEFNLSKEKLLLELICSKRLQQLKRWQLFMIYIEQLWI